MTGLLAASTVTVTNTGIDPATGSLGYRFEDDDGKLLATAHEPKPRRPFWRRPVPPASPAPFAFRLLICHPDGRPILDVVKQERHHNRLRGSVALASGRTVGTMTVRNTTNSLRRDGTMTYRLFDAGQRLCAEIAKQRDHYAVRSPVGWEVGDIRYSGGLPETRGFYQRRGARYAFQRLDEVPKSMRALLLAWSIFADLSG